MADQVTYYAMFDELTSRERPRTVLRRVKNDAGTTDEIFARDLTWRLSSLLSGVERGDTMADFVAISEEEAERIVARLRAAGEAAE